MSPVVEELRSLYENHRLAVVAGEAVSAAAGVPSRTVVLRRLLEQARSSVAAPAEQLDEIEALIEAGRAREAFAAVEAALTPAGMGAQIERLWYAEDRPVPEVAAVLAAMVPKLSAIVSLSLDRVLSRALRGRWHTFSRVLADLGQRRRFLLLLHGTLFERDTWVLTAEQAARASFAEPVRKATLGAFLRSHTLLFVGCDPESGDLDPLLDELAATPSAQPPRHFALVAKDSLGFWRQHRLRAAGIELVPFDGARSDLAGAAEILAAVGGLQLPLPSEGAEETPHEGEPVCPFPGLSCFEEADSDHFFGREHDVDEALAKLGGAAGVRWLQIEGASGTGKSSLARAGIVPAVRTRGVDGGPESWQVAMLRPGTEPLMALASAVRPLAGDDAPPLDELCARLERPAGLTTFVREHVSRGTGLLLVVDQLEEAVTLGGDERAAAVAAFDRAIARALRDADGPLHLVTTIRSDHVGRLDRGLPALAALLNPAAARYTLRSMGGAALRAIIEAPARKVGLVWERDLAARVLADAGGTSASLPLVAHVLRALFDQREGRRLTIAAYDALGGVAGALTKSADDVLAPLDEAGRERARKMLLRLVKIGRGTTDTRQPAGRAEVLDAAGRGAEAVLDRLAGSRDLAHAGSAPARLVVVGTSDEGDRVDLVHEALLGQWTTLSEWIEARRKALEQRDDLEHQAQAWAAAGRPDAGLATGAQLAYLRGAEAPNEQARVFLQKSERRDRRRRRLQMAGLGGAVATALVMGTLAWWANTQRVEANQRLSDAIETANHVTFVVDRKLTPIAGAAAVRKELLARTAELQDKLVAGAPDSVGALHSRMTTHGQRGDLALSHDNLVLARQEYEAAWVLAQRLAAARPGYANLQRNLAVCWNKLGEVSQAEGDLEGARKAFEKSRAIVEALASANPSSVAFQRDLANGFIRLGDVLQLGGDLHGARGAVDRSLEISRTLASAEPGNADLQRDLFMSLVKLGNVLKIGGDLQGAHDAYDRSLRIIDVLASADPTDADLQRDLSVSFDKLGEVLRDQGDFAGARQAFDESLAITGALVSRDPTNARLQRDLVIKSSKLGDLLRARGDLESARDAFEESLATLETLAVADPTNVSLQYLQCLSFSKLGEVLLAEEDLDSARELFEKSLEILETLAAADPTNADLQHDLALGYEKRGDVLLAGGDLEGAREAFEKCLEITKAAAAANPTNATFQRNVSVGYKKLAGVLLAGEDFRRAHEAFDKFLEIQKALAAADPTNAILQYDLSDGYEKLAELLEAEGDLKGARDAFDRSLRIRSTLASADPTNAELQADLAVSHGKLAYLAAALNDADSAWKHIASARAIIDALDKNGKMSRHARFIWVKSNLDALPR